MSDDRLQTQDCLDAETLAAFIDGRLEPRDREAVEAHLADCEDCYEVWMESTAAHTTQTAARTRRPWLAGVALVAAVVVAAVWTWPVLRPRDPAIVARDGLVAAVGTARFSEARLSADFAWGQSPSATRGAVETPSVPLRQAALNAIGTVEEHPSPLAYRAAAAGHLVLGEYDNAVHALEFATTLAPDDGLIRLDLGAALLERFRHTQVPSDAAQALEATEHALSLLKANPSAMFNRALALEANGRFEDAVDAWDAFLVLDAASQWRTEAIDRQKRLRTRIGGPPLAETSSLSPDDVRALATDEPWRLLDYLDRVVIPAWIEGTLQGKRMALSEGVTVATVLKAHGRDHYPHDLLTGLDALSPGESSTAADALRTLQDARSEFNLSHYDKAATAATTAALGLRRVGLPTLDAEMQSAFANYFGSDRAQAVATGDQIARKAAPLGYLRISGRATYIAGQYQIGNVDLANGLATLERSADLYTRAGDRAQVAATRSLLMLASTSAGQTEDAWRHAADSASRLNGMASPRLRYMVLSNLHYHLRDSNLVHSAVALGPRVQAIADEWNDPVYSTDVALLQAGLHQRLRDDDGVRRVVADARAHAAQITSPETRAQYDHALDFELARAFHTRDSQTALSATNRIIDYLTSRQRPLLKAEAYLLRGRAHAALGDSDAAEADWAAGLAVVEHEQSLIDEPHLAIPRSDRQWDLYAALIDHRRDNARRSLEIAERARVHALLSRDVTAGFSEDVSDLRWLPADTTVIVYAVLSDALAIWTIRGGHVDIERRQLPGADLDRAVTRFTDALRTGGLSADERGLAELLLPTLPLTGGRLVVIPDGPLHRLPFAALRQADGRRLVEAVEVSSAPSLTWLKRSIEAPKAQHSRALLVGFGGARTELGLSALPRVSDEIRNIARVYGTEVTPVINTDATAETVTSLLPSHSVLHIAGHAIADNRRPWESRIFLAPKAGRSELTVSDIARLRLQPGSIVLLSGCSTAAGTVFRGEGVVSLARPFLAAGASAVLASLWPVRDDDAERVMVAVHQELARGASLVTALSIAQRAELQAHPTRWQPWIVLGGVAMETR